MVNEEGYTFIELQRMELEPSIHRVPVWRVKCKSHFVWSRERVNEEQETEKLVLGRNQNGTQGC